MSDYVREKVLRVPISLSDIKMENSNDIIYNLEEKYPNLFSYGTLNMFQIAPTNELYLDYILEYEYGANGEYGKIRELYPSEKEKYRPIFQQILPNINMGLVHLVEFCWYNCSEAPDYYDINIDEFYKEI